MFLKRGLATIRRKLNSLKIKIFAASFKIILRFIIFILNSKKDLTLALSTLDERVRFNIYIIDMNFNFGIEVFKKIIYSTELFENSDIDMYLKLSDLIDLAKDFKESGSKMLLTLLDLDIRFKNKFSLSRLYQLLPLKDVFKKTFKKPKLRKIKK